MKKDLSTQETRHWRKSLFYLGIILSIWFIVSFGCGILFRDWVDAHLPMIGNAPFGFWMAQQGSIICFVLLLIAYSIIMNRLDETCETNGKENK